MTPGTFAAETVTIAALGHDGDGIAETPSGRVFVPFALPSETVSIEREGGRGTVLRIETQSGDRVEPFCRHFGVCGGCALQHLAESAYLAWKRELVLTAFAQRGIAAPVEAVVAVGRGARRRAALTAVGIRGGAIVGLNQRSSNDVLALEECPVLLPAITDRLDLLRAIAGAVLQPGQRGRVLVLAADNGLDIAVERERKSPPDRPLLQKLARLGSHASIARLSLDGEPVVMARRPELSADGTRLFPPPGGFVQASTKAEAAMSEIVLGAAGKGPVADLFAGIGTFSLRLAKRAPVTAVEGDADTVAALQYAANQAKSLKPIAAQRRDLFRTPLRPLELKPFAAVVFDPPRAGAKTQAEALAASNVPVVVAVSCNPATLARDARILIDGGYRPTRVVPIDQFAYSAEIEAVAVFER